MMLAEEFGGFGVEGEGGVFIGAFLAEHFAAFGGEDEGEEILAFEDAGAVGEAAEVGLERGLGRGEVAELERGDGAAVVGGFDVGGLRVFLDEVGVFFDGLLVVGFAGGVFGLERGGESGEGLGFEEGGDFVKFGGGGRAVGELFQRCRGLFWFSPVR